MRPALKVVMQNDGDVVDVILLYIHPMSATGTKSGNTEASSDPGDARGTSLCWW